MSTVYYLGVSGGKDSTAAALWMIHESGYPLEQIRFVFDNTGNEHPVTLDYIAMLSERVHPIVTLYPELDYYQLAAKKKRFPSAKARFCTQYLKQQVTQADVLAIMRGGSDVLLHSGVRRDESTQRSKLQARDFDTYYMCDVLRPIFEWTEEQVFAYLAKWGIPRNPLYDLGAKRVGCWPCHMSSKEEIRILSDRDPGRVDFIEGKECEIGSTFFRPNTVPLAHRSKTVVTKKGRAVRVCTIRDVVAWSHTKHGGKQYEMHFDNGQMCSSALGMCE